MATKWCLTKDSRLAESRNHFLAVRALVMVSWVVNVFEAMMKRVVSGERVFRVSTICVPSTFDTKWG